MRDKPYYDGSSIATVKSLAQLLEINESQLKKYAENTEDFYAYFSICKENKPDRDVVEAKPALKNIQRLINSRIMSRVKYPSYLMGGIKDEENKRDYLNNSKLHLNKSTLINLDIKKFFPSIKEHHVKEVFMHLFKFSEEVSELLTKLTTLKGAVPQGAATSTYIANLIFFNSEYKVVSDLRNKNIVYSRLLDDVTLSSDSVLDNATIQKSIKTVVGMFTVYNLKLHSGKKRIEYRENVKSKYEVTGAWVKYGEPKIRQIDRNRVRSAVHHCEKDYADSPYKESYHLLWNKTSGRVAQLGRFNHKAEEKKLRLRLSKVLPLYDQAHSRTIEYKINDIIKKKKKNKIDIRSDKVISYVNKLRHELGILSRTDKGKSKKLRSLLNNNFW